MSTKSTHQWLARFAVQLMRLRNDISIRYAVSRAVQVFGHSCDLEPETAAQIDAKVIACSTPHQGLSTTLEAVR